ncbi:hypothetical protein V8C42DRAFT_305039 [Trichoderma barbatum]
MAIASNHIVRPRKRGKKQMALDCLAGMGNGGDLPDAGFGPPPLPLVPPLCSHLPSFSNTKRAGPWTDAEGETETRLDSGPIRVGGSLVYHCIPAARWGVGDTRTSTPALRHAWNHHGHARNTIRYMAEVGLLAPELGVSQSSPPKPKDRPGQNGIMASVQAGLLLMPPSNPHFPVGRRHKLTGTPSSVVTLFFRFSLDFWSLGAWACNSMTDANDPTLCSISNFVFLLKSLGKKKSMW